jgi:serine/threonine protein kinase/Tfp pilus assembly protein PilF
MSASVAKSSQTTDAALADLVDRLTARLKAGEAPDLDGLVREHPEYAEELRQLLPAVQMLADLSRSGESRGVGLAWDADTLGELGDFRIIREVGRGGMGVVYEAEQQSLLRRVALKVLPFAATMDPKQLQRFRNEALAAASLHHEHIVPVYAVGCEKGVHYYAMQFIDGTTLGEAIAGERGCVSAPSGDEGQSQLGPLGALTQPRSPETVPVVALSTERVRDRAFYRRAAELIADAADALEYAHSLGVVHRDVKPGNLLVDAAGKVWVADFGLARFGPDAGLTMTGDLLGTLRYMAPEQALAKHGLVDHRADVYGLGATLYELLTGRPAVGGEDKQEILRQIAFEEPVALRKLDKAIPVELETIALKCLAKEPAERYATAGELAADLRRFVDDKPIQARRPTVRQRFVRLTRRHPLTTAIIVLATVGLLSAAWYWDRQRVLAEGAARVVAGEAAKLQHERRYPEALTVARRAFDLLPSRLGDARLRQAVAAQVADLALLCRLEDARLQRLTDEAALSAIDPNRAVKQAADAFREESGVDLFAGEQSAVVAALASRAIRDELVAALDDLAATTRNAAECLRLFGLADALDQNDQGIAHQWRLLPAAPSLGELRGLAARVDDGTPSDLTIDIATRLREGGDPEAAIRLLRTAQIRRPDNLWVVIALAQTLSAAGPKHAAEAARFWTATLTLRPHSVGARVNLAKAFLDLSRYDDAIEELGKCEETGPAAFVIHQNRAAAYAMSGRLEQAAVEYRRALELNPDDAQVLHGLGSVLAQLKRPQEAVDALQKAERRQPTVKGAALLSQCLAELRSFADAEASAHDAVNRDPQNAEAHFRLAIALSGQHRPKDAADEFQRSIDLNPTAVAYYNLGLEFRRLNQPAEATAALQQAVRLDPDHLLAHRTLARILAEANNWPEVEVQAREAIRIDKRHAPDHYNLGMALSRQQNPTGAVKVYQEAIKLDPNMAEAHCNLGILLVRMGKYAEGLVELKRGDELGRQQPNWNHPSEAWVGEAERKAALYDRMNAFLATSTHPRGPAARAGEALALAEACIDQKMGASAAVRLYAAAFAAEPKLAEPPNYHRYDAACVAALAGCGRGGEPEKLDETERTRLRRQAHDWLAADLAAWEKQLARPEVRPDVRQFMTRWQKNRSLTGVRDAAELEKLPEAERADWQKLWARVAELLSRAGDAGTSQPPTGTNP